MSFMLFMVCILYLVEEQIVCVIQVKSDFS
jgi:hypothetical protein